MGRNWISLIEYLIALGPVGGPRLDRQARIQFGRVHLIDFILGRHEDGKDYIRNDGGKV